jgi:hypothetical protein
VIAAFCDLERFPPTVNDVTLTTTLARYVQGEFRAWNVDAEHNRSMDDVKKLEGKAVKPDIIAHRRRRTSNLLVIEAKKSTNVRGVAEARRRLEVFHLDPQYPYRHCAFLTLRFDEDDQPKCSVEWFCCAGRRG